MTSATPEAASGWDFFISYTQDDQAWAEWIAWILEESGYRVLIQAWDMVPGSNWITAMHEGLSRADRMIAVLSPSYLTSQYGSAEWQAAWAADPAGIERKLLLARVAECEQPGLLAGVVRFDLMGLAEARARAVLRERVAAGIAGRAKPATPPPYPGRAIRHEPRFPGGLPTIWKVPARNPNFTGRGQELADLNTALAAGAAVTLASIRGLAGVGKSQLATEYAHRHATDYDLVYWISAEEPTVIPIQFAELAADIGLGILPDANKIHDQVHARLREVAGWLLIFDNAAAVEDLQPWIPRVLMPPGIPGHILVTTRRRAQFGGLGEVLELDLMQPDDAVALLSKRMPGIAADTARAIATELDGLPLALEQAAAYLDQTGIDPADYLTLLQGRAIEVFDRGAVVGRKDTIATLWDISLEQISVVSPAAVELMDLCAYLAPEPIPQDLFTAHADLLPPALSAAAADPLTFGDTVGVLVDYSLLKRKNRGLQVHRLVQGAVRWHHQHAQADPHARPGAEPADAIRARTEALLASSNPGRPDDPDTWPKWAQLIPHLLTADLEATTSQELCLTACDACRYLLARGEAAGCRAVAQRLHDRWRERFGDDDHVTLSMAIHLARALRYLGQADQAHQLDQDTYSRRLRLLGPDDPATLTAASNLASDLSVLGQKDEALELDEATYQRQNRILGPDHPDTLNSASNLAIDLSVVGQGERAAEILEDTLDRRRRVQGNDHPSTLKAAADLAVIWSMGQDQRARQMLEDVLPQLEWLQGEDHLHTLAIAMDLAESRYASGETAAAVELGERTLARLRAVHPDHEVTKICAANLANYARGPIPPRDLPDSSAVSV